jgi:small subunit ribosomal protein S5
MSTVNELGLIEKIVHLNRVSKVVKGGKNFKFTALVVVGDGKGKVGYGYGKANQVPDAIVKATERAKKNMITVPIIDGTIPYEVIGEFGAARVLLKPAVKGTGIIAGGPVRAIMEAAGITDILSKAIGSRNPINVIKATIVGITMLRSPEHVSEIRGKELSIGA